MKKTLNASTLLHFEWLDEPVLNPNGELAVATLSQVNLEGHRLHTNLWLMGTTGQAPRQDRSAHLQRRIG